MKRIAARLVNGTLRRFGYEIRRVGSAPVPTPDPWLWVRETQGIKTVVDVGASTGDFAAFLAEYFRPSATYVFEPLAACRPHLEAKARAIPNFEVFTVALSDRVGQACLYENSYAPATSLLRVSAISRAEFPETSGETPSVVQVARLDDLLDPDALEKNILVKIDVQGLEDRVLRGGWRVFSAARCILLEMSFVPMYEGQPLFEEVHELLVQLGFRFAGTKNQVNSSKLGQPLFAHCLYVRSDRSPGAKGDGGP